MANIAYLYYGNGEVTIEGHEIRGIQIRYSGNIKVEKTANDNFVLVHKNNGIIIFPLGEGFLSNLFNYNGSMRIKSLLAADVNGERVQCLLKRVMDYSDFITSNAEDMTILSEDMSAGYDSNKEIVETPQIIENLHTRDKDTPFYLSDGSIYEGCYHIHLKDSSAMTGMVHDDKSEDLYFKQLKNGGIKDKLISTKNPSHTPMGLRERRRLLRRR
tara:strand:- start:219 stop:863 length:645 start_codon:yes stop_codon:yes gene_type:complete